MARGSTKSGPGETVFLCGKLSPVRPRERKILLIVFVIGVLALPLIDDLRRGSGAGSAAPAPKAQAAAFRGSPPPLAALHAQADALLTGGARAFTARLRALRGYPIVVNKWASWCGPCESEFPIYQRVSVAFGRQVAFVGIDAKDADGSAAAFLQRYPVSYPSYVDPTEAIARTLTAGIYFPQTVFIDRRGRIVYDHVGPYETVAALASAVRRYALG